MTVDVGRMLSVLLLSCVALACGRAGEQAVATTVPTPTRPPAVAREHPQAILPDGTAITLELAATNDEIRRGLMFRPSLAEDRGMLFIFGQERLPSFWMKDTLIALDIIFLDRSGRIVDIAADAQPCKVDPCPQFVPKRPAAAVLEVAAGGAARHGLAEGDQLAFERVPEFPLP